MARLDPKKAEELYGHDPMSSMAEGTYMPIGAIYENRRLAPLLEKLIAVVEAADMLSREYAKPAPDVLYRKVLRDQSAKAIADLRLAVMGEGK